MRRRVLVVGLLLGMAVCAAAQTNVNPTKNDQAKDATCVVSGMVIRKTDSAPLKNATVQLSNGEDRDHTIATKTGVDGHFELRNVPAGQYKLSASRNGYVEYEFGQKKPNDPGATFTLRSGQSMSDLIFKLGRAAVITGRIFDEDGEPMNNAVVTAMRQVYTEGEKEYEEIDRQGSNDLGEYRIQSLAPGRYIVSAQAPSWDHIVGDREYSANGKTVPEKGYPKIYYPSATDSGKATSVEVKEGDEITSIDIFMKEVPVYRIRGRVVNTIGNGKSGRTGLSLTRRTGKWQWDFESWTSTKKSDGTFEVPEVAPGEYTLIAFANEEGKNYSAQEDVEVVNGDVEGITIVIGKGVEIQGRVIWDGKVSLGGDDEVVEAVPRQAGQIGALQARVEDDQTFRMKDVPQGAFDLRIVGPSKDCYIEEMRQSENVLDEDTLRVGKGEPGSITIVVNSRGARLKGTVTSEESLPVAGVWVVAVPEEAKRKVRRLFKTVTTDQNGQYELRGLAPGKYKLFSWDGAERGAWEDEDFLKPFEEKGVTVEVVDGDAKAADLSLIRLKDGATAKSE
jgi:hypothetical protein